MGFYGTLVLLYIKFALLKLKKCLFASILLDVFRDEFQSQCYSIVPSIHHKIHLKRMDSGFHICF